MSNSTPHDPAEPIVTPSQWSHYTPRFVTALSMMAAGVGMIIGFAISQQPVLFIAATLIIVGYNLSILEERAHARNSR
jgi:hypothetical protein